MKTGRAEFVLSMFGNARFPGCDGSQKLRACQRAGESRPACVVAQRDGPEIGGGTAKFEREKRIVLLQ